MYQFSVPMPQKTNLIDSYVYINSKIKKSKITGFYFAFPVSSKLTCGFEQGRNTYLYEKDFDFWKELIIYSQKKGFKVTYLFNSPKPLSLYGNNLKKQLDKLDNLIAELVNCGCTRFRVCNVELLEYLILKYPNLEFCVSTSNEYMSLGQYINFMEYFPQITEIVPSFEMNKNFKLLKNLRTKYPNLDIELMINEGCLAGCPFRNFHNISLPDSCPIDIPDMHSRIEKLSECTNVYCRKIYHGKKNFEQLFKSNIVYPWQIDEYAKIGINKFKLVGRNNPAFITGEYTEYNYIYLKGVDDFSYIQNTHLCTHNNYICGAKNAYSYPYKETRKILPNIKTIKKLGVNCLSKCNTTCRYCIDHADIFLKHTIKEEKKK